MKPCGKTFQMRVAAMVIVAALLSATGCLQLELGVELHEDDAGATVTERLRMTRLLLDLNRGHAGGNEGIARHLQRSAAEARMAHMGEGIVLQSHEVVDLEGGSRESVTVYRIPDIEDLRLPNPFIQNRLPGPAYRFEFAPTYSSNHRWQIGTVVVRMVQAESSEGSAFDNVESVPAETPHDLQMYRDLQPIFADLMQEFQIEVTLTIPDQPRARGRPAGDQTIKLLSFHYRDLDGHARRFVENQEAMLALMQFNLSDSAITAHTREYPSNPLVPVHRGRSNYGSTSFRIRPTRHMFQTYFAGRPKSEGGDQ